MELENNIRSEEVQEIMEQMPRKFILWGSSFIVGVILLLIFLSAIIQYPDVINGNAIVTTENPPAAIMAKSNGNIEKIFVADKCLVTVDEPIAIIKNPAKYNEVLILDSILNDEAINGINEFSYWKNKLNSFQNLGEVNVAFAGFMNSISDNYFLVNKKITIQQADQVQAQSVIQANQLIELNNEYENAKKTFELKEKQFQQQKKLYDEKIISANDWNQIQTDYLQSKNQLESFQLNIKNNKLQNFQLKGQVSQLQQSYQKELNDKNIQLITQKEQLKAAIIVWKEKYLLKASVAGKVSFQNFWSENQTLKSGDEFCKIVSENKNIICKVLVPQAGSAKLKIGQKARLVLFNYPENEFGFIFGKVDRISLVPIVTDKEIAYAIDISLPSPIITSLKKEVKFMPEMQGSVEIITERKSILMRLTDSWLNYLRKKN
jgi:multidrug resistance efflux pump